MSEVASMRGSIPGTPRIAVDIAGSGPLVVLMHGIGGNRSNWRDQLPALSPHFQAVAWDARGYGESDDYEGALDFGDFSTDLVRLLDHFKAPAAHLVGLSMGGRIALDFCDRHPERVRTLTLCDTHLGFAHMPEEKRREFVRLRQEPLLAGKEPRDIAEGVARTLVSPRAIPGAYERLVASMCALHKASYLKSIAASVGYATVARLAAIRVPTHVIVGEDDRLTPPSAAQELVRGINGARYTLIAAAGHLSNIEQPERFNAALLAFLHEHAG
jgi:3-oxoadipate enol-lactonase